jgi:HEPN domain-containing protein
MKRNPREEALRWLIQAQDEFQDAEELRQRGRFYLALFHFQQSAEKALKAYLYFRLAAREIFFTHSIDELLSAAIAIDAEFAHLERAKKLDQYYIPTRYPNGLPGGIPSRFYTDPEEAQEAMELTRKLLNTVVQKIEPEGQNEL